MELRPVTEVTAEMENFRLEPRGQNVSIVKRDMVKPEPEGTIVLLAFCILRYEQDADGSALARLGQITSEGRSTGLDIAGIGLYPDSAWVLDNLNDLPRTVPLKADEDVSVDLFKPATPDTEGGTDADAHLRVVREPESEG